MIVYGIKLNYLFDCIQVLFKLYTPFNMWVHNIILVCNPLIRDKISCGLRLVDCFG